MSFARFRANSRKWARVAGRECEVPELAIPAHPAADDPDTLRTLSEFRRLVGEGEPVILRNARSYVERVLEQPLQYRSAEELVQDYGDIEVRVAPVPYAGNFAVEEETMPLSEFHRRCVPGTRTRHVPVRVLSVVLMNVADICTGITQDRSRDYPSPFPSPLPLLFIPLRHRKHIDSSQDCAAPPTGSHPLGSGHHTSSSTT